MNDLLNTRIRFLSNNNMNSDLFLNHSILDESFHKFEHKSPIKINYEIIFNIFFFNTKCTKRTMNIASNLHGAQTIEFT